MIRARSLGRTLLVLLVVNILPLAVYLWFLLAMVERYVASPRGRLFAACAVCLSTFVPLFSAALSNHHRIDRAGLTLVLL